MAITEAKASVVSFLFMIVSFMVAGPMGLFFHGAARAVVSGLID
jgi:hypothetical protein|tara:strand:+ start:419 stop:550 length:132 start_codon:yes stop_codon:yes gene_type:complete